MPRGGGGWTGRRKYVLFWPIMGELGKTNWSIDLKKKEKKVRKIFKPPPPRKIFEPPPPASKTPVFWPIDLKKRSAKFSNPPPPRKIFEPPPPPRIKNTGFLAYYRKARKKKPKKTSFVDRPKKKWARKIFETPPPPPPPRKIFETTPASKTPVFGLLSESSEKQIGRST